MINPIQRTKITPCFQAPPPGNPPKSLKHPSSYPEDRIPRIYGAADLQDVSNVPSFQMFAREFPRTRNDGRMDDSPPLLLSLCIPPLEWGSADIESEKERTPGEDMEAGEVTMQMQEYIYLGTTPMYFLGASGRIVGSGRIESPHLHLPPRRGPLSSFSRGISNPSSLSLSLSLSLFTLSSLSHFHHVYARECHTTPDRYSGDLRAN